MPIRVACRCGRSLNLADDLRGKRIRCPECAAVVAVPDTDTLVNTARLERPRGSKESRPPQQKSSDNNLRTKGSEPPVRHRRPKTKTVHREDRQEADWLDEQTEPAWEQPLPSRKNGKAVDTRAKEPRRAKFPLFILLIVGGAGLLLMGIAAIVVIAVVVRGISSVETPEVTIPNIASVNIPENIFPSRPTFRPAFSSGVQLARTRLTGTDPGESTQMNLYLPPGEHDNRSLGCVLVAPAGTNLLIGNALDGDDYHAETLPYAEAGFMSIQYSLDGGLPSMETATDSEFRAAYGEFRAVAAGTLNTRMAIEFVKARFPEIDPARIYTAGHSSAGTVSLLAAEELPEVAACIAYAPCSDPEERHSGFSGVFGIDLLFPGLLEFDRRFSPIGNLQKLKCPVFLFHARDDSVVDVAVSRRFVEQAKYLNQHVEYVEVADGDHYDSMISPGIAQAIEWLTRIDSRNRKIQED
jgi:pimeloyl-ACP methyl ester carboxylesterase